MVQHIVTGESTISGEVYLVTGSHGHIGSYIVEELCRQKDNIQIICMDNFYNANIDNLKESYKVAENKNIKIRDVRVDITDYNLMRETFLKYNPDYVFHKLPTLLGQIHISSIKTYILYQNLLILIHLH